MGKLFFGRSFFTLAVNTLAVCSLFAAAGTQAASIYGSKHDLSAGVGQVCAYCHAPHNASKQAGLAEAPLWNRTITNLDAFIPYGSPTMTQTCPTRPSGISLACLSCHDGTQADAKVASPTNPGGGNNLSANGDSAVYLATGATGGDQHNRINPGVSGGGTALTCGSCHNTTPSSIYSAALTLMAGPDLRNDHPISMQYPVANANFVFPPDVVKGWGDIKLFGGKVECPTCHNVHDPTNAPFLRATNSGSALCLRCHNK